jgi:hypothetical protein
MILIYRIKKVKLSFKVEKLSFKVEILLSTKKINSGEIIRKYLKIMIIILIYNIAKTKGNSYLKIKIFSKKIKVAKFNQVK